MSVNYVVALLMLEIWSVEKIDKRLPRKYYNRCALYRKTRGIVLHDRAMNGEFDV
jgi:hypothetical protein